MNIDTNIIFACKSKEELADLAAEFSARIRNPKKTYVYAHNLEIFCGFVKKILQTAVSESMETASEEVGQFILQKTTRKVYDYSQSSLFVEMQEDLKEYKKHLETLRSPDTYPYKNQEYTDYPATYTTTDILRVIEK